MCVLSSNSFCDTIRAMQYRTAYGYKNIKDLAQSWKPGIDLALVIKFRDGTQSVVRGKLEENDLGKLTLNGILVASVRRNNSKNWVRVFSKVKGAQVG